MENQGKKSFWSVKTGVIAMLLAPLLAVAPLLIGAAGAAVFCGPGANEANCGFAVLPWMMLLTLPAGALMFIAGLIIFIVALAKKTN